MQLEPGDIATVSELIEVEIDLKLPESAGIYDIDAQHLVDGDGGDISVTVELTRARDHEQPELLIEFESSETDDDPAVIFLPLEDVVNSVAKSVNDSDVISMPDGSD